MLLIRAGRCHGKYGSMRPRVYRRLRRRRWSARFDETLRPSRAERSLEELAGLGARLRRRGRAARSCKKEKTTAQARILLPSGRPENRRARRVMCGNGCPTFVVFDAGTQQPRSSGRIGKYRWAEVIDRTHLIPLSLRAQRADAQGKPASGSSLSCAICLPRLSEPERLLSRLALDEPEVSRRDKTCKPIARRHTHANSCFLRRHRHVRKRRAHLRERRHKPRCRPRAGRVHHAGKNTLFQLCVASCQGLAADALLRPHSIRSFVSASP